VTPRVLIAGIGNIFLGDDGFGVEVARRLALETLPAGVAAADYGIRGIHLAHQLLEDYDLAILVDAVARGGAPGTIYVIEPDLDADPSSNSLSDAHDMVIEHVFAMVRTLGGRLPRTLIVGCEAADVSERIGLSDAAEAAIPTAIEVIRGILRGILDEERSAAVSAEPAILPDEKIKEA
jgi:hydrogenase maturation protease